MTLSVIDIVEGTSVDGPGLRTSIYFAGCAHHCPGCHNPQSWDIKAGKPIEIDELLRIVAYNGFNVTFSGGDPFYQAEGAAQLARRVRAELGKTVWCYTGYRWEDIVGDKRLRSLLENVDVLVDSPFLLAERDTTLRFRGSRNQRIILVPPSLATGQIAIWSPAL